MGDLLWGLALIGGLLWLVTITEFSFLPSAFHRGVYERCAWLYESKWHKGAYDLCHKTNIRLLRLLEEHLTGKNSIVLDLACGTGRMSMLLLAQSWFRGKIEAVDFSGAMLAKLSAKLEEVNRPDVCLKIQEQDLADWQGEENAADLVFLMEVSEFLPDFAGLLQKISQSLKPEALLVCTKPNELLAPLFFGRKQSIVELKALAGSVGLEIVLRTSWQWRYELLVLKKVS